MILSIVVPVYKIEESYFRECLDSIIAIENNDVEVILVDDGSPDNCGVICDEYAEKDARFRVLHKENTGVSAARNDGIRMAQGKYITFVDADDWVDAETMDALLRTMNEETVDVIVCDYFENTLTNQVKIQPLPEMRLFKSAGELRCLQKMVFGNEYGTDKVSQKPDGFSSAWAKFYRREMLNEKNCFFSSDLIHGEDTFFLFKVLLRSVSIYHSDKAFYHYRMRANSVCHEKTIAGFEEIVRLTEAFRRETQESNCEEDFSKEINRRCVDHLLGRVHCRWNIGKNKIATFFVKCKEFRKVCSVEPMKSCVEGLDYVDCGFKKKVKVFLLKHHFVVSYMILFSLRSRFRNSKKEKLY